MGDNNNFRIRSITLDDFDVQTIAGDGIDGFEDGTGLNARIGDISCMTLDNEGNLILADFSNNAVRQVTTPGFEVTTLAGTPGEPVLFRDAAGTDARFNQPNDVAVERSGDLVVSELAGSRIRRISKTPRIDVNGSQIGERIRTVGGEDWFSFDVWQTEEHTISINAGSLDDPQVELIGPNTSNGPVIATDDNTGMGNNAEIVLDLDPGRYYLRVRNSAGTQPRGAFTARVVSESLQLTVSTTSNGRIEFAGDNAWFEFDQTMAAANFQFDIMNAPGLNNNTHLYVYSDDGAGQASLLLNNLPTGLYWVRVRADEFEDFGDFQIQVQQVP